MNVKFFNSNFSKMKPQMESFSIVLKLYYVSTIFRSIENFKVQNQLKILLEIPSYQWLQYNSIY